MDFFNKGNSCLMIILAVFTLFKKISVIMSVWVSHFRARIISLGLVVS